MSPTKEPPRVFRNDVLGPCPDCGRAVGAAIGEGEKPVGLTHVMPMCATFEAMSVEDFIHWMRVIREGAAT